MTIGFRGLLELFRFRLRAPEVVVDAGEILVTITGGTSPVVTTTNSVSVLSDTITSVPILLVNSTNNVPALKIRVESFPIIKVKVTK